MAKIDKRAMAYANVYDVPKNEISKPEHQKIIDNALEEVWQHPRNFPGETDAQREMRIDLQSPASGSANELAMHLSKYTSFEFPEKPAATAWEKIFIVFKRMNDGRSEQEPVESETTEPEVAEVPSSDTTHFSNNIINGGKTEMGTIKEEINKITEEQVVETGRQETTPQANVEKVADKVTQDVVRKKLEKETSFRADAAATGRVTRVYVSKPSLGKILIQGENATGVVSKPEETLRAFISKMGRELVDPTDPSKGYVFKKADPAFMDKCMEINDLLEKAAATPDAQDPIKVNIPKSTGVGAIKGYALKITSGAQESGPMPVLEVINTLKTKTFGKLNAVSKDVQIQLANVAAHANSNKPEKSSNKAKAKAKAVGSLTLKVVGRKNIETSMVNYIQMPAADKSVAEKAPVVKSEIFCKYINDSDTTVTYRIPLVADQYKLEVVDPVAKEKLMPTVTVDLSPLDAKDANAVEQEIAAFSAIISQAAIVADGKDNFFSEINAEVESQRTATAAAEADNAGL